MSLPEEQHNVEIHENLKSWKRKPILQKIYHGFYVQIASYVSQSIKGKIVELGSGIGNLKMLIPNVICTDMFKNPWIDQVENAYSLSFDSDSVSNIILFDVFHHLQYPGTAINEFHRVLNKNGRIVIFEPCLSLFGYIVYGLFHHEPIGKFKKESWFVKSISDLEKNEYYAAQGNATRIFGSSKYSHLLTDWNIVKVKKISSLSYVLSGGYSKKQLYPDNFLPLLTFFDKILGFAPFLFATRLLVVMEKK
jgi:SAM-dependent methyltransferase